MFNRYKILAAYIFAIPLALLLGFLAASPGELTYMLIGILLFFLALPLFLKWHHAMLIIFWNSVFNVFFLPGQPDVWLVFAGLSFGLSVLSNVMGRKPFLPAPEMIRPLLFLTTVVLGTACYRGGIGIRSLGGSIYGGRYYVYVLGAIIGYFALTAVQIPIFKGRMMTGLFFLSGTSFALSNIIFTLGPAFFFLYACVPSQLAITQAANAYGWANIDRILGLGQAAIGALCCLLALYGIRGLFYAAKPWRFLLLGLTIGASFFAGYRSAIVILCLIFAFQFYFEGLLRTRFFPVFVGLAVCVFSLILFFANKMPLAVQRSVSFLPVNVDSAVRADAMGTLDWRWQMWGVVAKEVPKYLIVGKGYAIDPNELEQSVEDAHIGMSPANYESSMVSEDYHNGFLSVIVPFGILGLAAFLWVLFAGFRILYSNYRYGDARLRGVNSALLSYYLAYCISFFFLFGALSNQLFIFLGAVGLSVSLNGGVRRKFKPVFERSRASLSQVYAMEVG